MISPPSEVSSAHLKSMESDSIHIIELRHPDDPSWEEVGRLFEEMYRYMDNHGLILGLAKDGRMKWLEAARTTAGRFSLLLAASHGGRMIGFAHGALKFLPDYLGGTPAGVITHIYVTEGFRNAGVGRVLLERLEAWFREKRVVSVELQVLAGNQEGISFWERTGYAKELFQYRKMLGE